MFAFSSLVHQLLIFYLVSPSSTHSGRSFLFWIGDAQVETGFVNGLRRTFEQCVWVEPSRGASWPSSSLAVCVPLVLLVGAQASCRCVVRGSLLRAEAGRPGRKSLCAERPPSLNPWGPTWLFLAAEPRRVGERTWTCDVSSEWVTCFDPTVYRS